MKSVKVTPLIKNKNKTFTSLSFISKLIKRALVADLNLYVHDSELGEPLQSTYRALHITETFLLCVKNDILCSIAIT